MGKWEQLEKALNSFIDILRSLPEDLRSRAIDLLNNKLKDGAEERSGVSSKVQTPKSSSLPDLPARPASPHDPARRRKRGRPSTKKGRGSDAAGRKTDETETVGASSRSPRVCRKNPKFADFWLTSAKDDDENDSNDSMVVEKNGEGSGNLLQKMVDPNESAAVKVKSRGDDEEDVAATFMKSLEPVTVEIEDDRTESSGGVVGDAEKINRRGKKYECATCSKKYSSLYTLKEHEKIHRGESYICDHCGHSFASKTGFRQHQLYHSTEREGLFKCSRCMYVVRSQELLDEHHRLKHDENRPKNHVCDACGKSFFTSHQLDRHLLGHLDKKPHKCNMCSFETVHSSYLVRHKLNVHSEDGSRQLFQCEICRVVLRSKGTYKDHLQRHFKFHRKKCDICQKTFANASQLAAHKRSHQLPTLPCELCGKLLRNKHKLQAHLLTHSGEKEFHCPCCSYASSARHNMKKHCMNKHSVSYPPDKMKKIKTFDPFQILSKNTLKDPMALECIRKVQMSKMVSTGTDSNGDMIFDKFKSKDPEEDPAARLLQPGSVIIATDDKTPPPSIDELGGFSNPCVDDTVSTESKIFIRPLGVKVAGLAKPPDAPSQNPSARDSFSRQQKPTAAKKVGILIRSSPAAPSQTSSTQSSSSPLSF